MLFSRFSIAALLAIASTATANLTCETDLHCQKVICSVFDDICEQGQICEQLDAWPWYNCHEENKVEVSQCSKCGANTDCHELSDVVYCTCDGQVVPNGQDCATPTDTTEVCKDATTGMNRDCHESADCTSDGVHAFCICEDGRLVADNTPCPGWTEANGEGSYTQNFDSSNFDCATCNSQDYGVGFHDKECWDPDGNGEYGCYCNGRLVHATYPCSGTPDSVIENGDPCSNYCKVGNSHCFLELGNPVCRCSGNGLRVDPSNGYCGRRRNENNLLRH